MTRAIRPETCAGWGAVWAFWLIATRSHHPSLGLALIVTTCLIGAAAAVATLNDLVLIPRFWRRGHRATYGWALLGATVAATGGALVVIRLAYLHLWGPDADPNGAIKHFGIDLIGVAVHVLAAALVVRAAHLLAGRRARRRTGGST